MTRRGSLAYYLAGWVCGCLFMSLAVWLPRRWEPTHWTPGFRGASGFLAFYFLALVFGAFTALLFAFLLRRLVGVLGLRSLWQWVVPGSGLAALLIWGLAALGRAVDTTVRPLEFLLILLLGALRAVRPPPVWANLLVGAATAFVLYFIHRAFQPRPDMPEALAIPGQSGMPGAHDKSI